MTKEEVKMIFSQGLNYLSSQIELLDSDNLQLKNLTFLEYVEKNSPQICSENIREKLNNEELKEYITEISEIFTNIKEYFQKFSNSKIKLKICNIKEIQDVFNDYVDMLVNNLENLDLRETFLGWLEDGAVYNTRAEDKIISTHTAGIEILLAKHFEEKLDNFTERLSNVFNQLLEKSDKSNERKYDYMMLDRLRMDCDYFLGYGNAFLGHLYYKDIETHINEMIKIYESFSEFEKPKWITREDIDDYKKRMENKLEEKKLNQINELTEEEEEI